MIAFESSRDRAQLLLSALGIGIAFALLPLAAGLLGALVLYVGVRPAYARLSAYLPSRVTAILLVVATALLFFLPAAWLLTVAIDRAPQVLRQLTRVRRSSDSPRSASATSTLARASSKQEARSSRGCHRRRSA